MSEPIDKPLKILSLLEDNLDKYFRRGLVGKPQVEYFRKYSPTIFQHPTELVNRQFWNRLTAEAYDVIIFELESTQVDDLHQYLSHACQAEFRPEPAWIRLPVAVVAVVPHVTDPPLDNTAYLDFDGVWTRPLDKETIPDKLQSALVYANRRRRRLNRYHRIRRLCQAVNRDRRQLRTQMDLLCRDMINANVRFTETLSDLQRAYNFQTRLSGEFDRRYLMYKALQGLKTELPDCSSALYLCSSGQFEAHLASLTPPIGDDVVEIEELFADTVVKTVLASGRHVLLNDSNGYAALTPEQQSSLENLSLMGLPVFFDHELLAVLVFYRHRKQRFTKKDRDRLLPMIPPLSHALFSLGKLEQYLHTQ